MHYSERMMELANCKGQATLHDATKAPDAIDALNNCLTCPVIQECRDWVAPDTHNYSGVCGARIWIDGMDVTLLALEEADAVDSGEYVPSEPTEVYTEVDWQAVISACRGQIVGHYLPTPEKHAILEALTAAGKTGKEIAEVLGMHEHAVRNRRGHTVLVEDDVQRARRLGKALDAFG